MNALLDQLEEFNAALVSCGARYALNGDGRLPHATKKVGADDVTGFTGSDIPAFEFPEVKDPIRLACELSELARILGGERSPRPASKGNWVFLL